MYRIKVIFACLFACLLLSASACLGVAPAFSEGEEYTFYLYSASSQAKIVTTPPCFTGVFYALHKGEIQGESAKIYSSPQAVLSSYNAEVLFCEECGEVTSYYCYAPSMPYSVWLNDKKVNLHVAFRQDRAFVAVGTPVIFGGY